MAEKESQESPSGDEIRRRLRELRREDASFETKIERALELGRAYLDVDNAHLIRIDPRTDYWEAVASIGDEDGTYWAGQVIDLQQSCCRHTVSRGHSVALHDAAAQGWTDDPAFDAHDLQCYHGTPIAIGQETYGTVCFVSETARQPFQENENMFVELVAHFLENEIARNRFDIELTRRGNLITVLNRVLRHNLRNEITIIRGYAQLIAEQDESEGSQYGATVTERADRLIALSEKARKLESVVTEDFERQERNLASLLGRAVRAVETDYPRASIAVEAPEDLTLAVRPSIETGIRELVENAAKHAGSDPTVTVSVDVDPDEVAIHVADDGPGLADIEQQVLNDGVETPLAHGLGLGLWLVYWIVTSHEGTVEPEVTDEETRMTVRLPRTTADPERIDSGRQERAVEEVRDQFRAVFEDAFDTMVITDDEGRCIDVNKSASDLLGVPRADLLGRPLKSFCPDGDEFEAAWQECLTGATSRETVPLVAADGTERVVDCAVSTDIVPDQHLVVIREVIERQERELELVRLQQALDTVLSNMPVVLWTTDEDGVFTRSRGAALSRLGLEPDEVVGESVFEVYAGLPEVRTAIERALDGENLVECVTVDGATFETWSHPLRSETGDVVGTVGLAYELSREDRELPHTADDTCTS